MRSVPHRVVCLLGLDDGAFPRQASARRRQPAARPIRYAGDRDPRTEDRQLLLDALLAAREALIITYSGNDERTNAPLPPAVPVGELLDAIDATARVAPAGATRRASDQVVIRHPLQAFDPRNFVGAGVRTGARRRWILELRRRRAGRGARIRRAAPRPAAVPARAAAAGR